ncbi:MAG: DUF2948 family protein [Caulobacteraceae bacterium]|nr:DUF2948 family protein [Caulobacter sp.]
MTAAAPPLKLLAQDVEDLQLISAALQDAVVRLADISYAPAARTLTFPVCRFRWEGDGSARVSAAVQFGDVLGVQARGEAAGARDRTASLLAIEFAPAAEAEDPGGAVMLRFAGGGDIRLQVECIDAAMADLAEPWTALAKPRHGA